MKSESGLALLPFQDTYTNLTLKTKLGAKWAYENTNAAWIVKADDDTLVNFDAVRKFLSTLDKETPTFIGNAMGHVTVRNSFMHL